jgi:cyclophilin family peptidyl-prolyl cis-trans isomerase
MINYFKELFRMPKKKVKKVQPGNTDKIIQGLALAVILIIVGVFAWNMLPKKQSVRESACPIFDSIPAADQYQSAPPLLIDQGKSYYAKIKMAKGGEVALELYVNKAPVTVNSFIFLACKGFYDGVTFHRVLDGFMAQTGDPTGTGMGSPGYRFANEDSDLKFDKAGVLAMANSGRDTNGSQFFITFGPAENLNGGYTIFGQVVEGMDVVNAITRRDPQQNPTFEGDAIDTITVTQE